MKYRSCAPVHRNRLVKLLHSYIIVTREPGVEEGAAGEGVVENEQVLPSNSGDASFFLEVTF